MSDPTTTSTSESKGSKGSSANKAPDFKINATEILKDYKDNEVAADKKYKGKVVQISGTVGEIKKDILGDIYVIVGTGAAFEFPECQVYFQGDATNKAADLKKGGKVTVKGTVDGLMMNVQIKDAVFVE